MKNAIFTICFACLMASCGSLSESANAGGPESMAKMENQIITFENANLQLNAITEGETAKATENVRITLNINLAEGQYSGKSGCNNYFGKVELINKDQLVFYPGGMTEMMCAEEIMAWEAKYMNALTDETFFVNIQKNTFMLINQNGELQMQFNMITEE